MPEELFWKCTPRKLLALAAVHEEANNPEKVKARRAESEKSQLTFVDKIF